MILDWSRTIVGTALNFWLSEASGPPIEISQSLLRTSFAEGVDRTSVSGQEQRISFSVRDDRTSRTI